MMNSKYAVVALAVFVLPLPGQRGDRTSVWEHLQKSYDKDGDGKITAAEYSRGSKQFKNLDRNGDAAITEADFERSRRGAPRGREKPDRRAGLARTLGDTFGSFLNTDGKPGIDAAEWTRIIRTLAPDDDGVIPKDNLANLTGTAGQGRMAQYVGNRLPRALDLNQDGKITVSDLKGLFELLDTNGDGNIEQGKEIVMPPGVGEMAPDFTLPHAADKAKTVKLSSFRGKKPVALIFGSYT